jgi:hypothetical protein
MKRGMETISQTNVNIASSLPCPEYLGSQVLFLLTAKTYSPTLPRRKKEILVNSININFGWISST